MPHSTTPGPFARAVGAVHTAAWSLPPVRTDYTLTRGLRVPTRNVTEAYHRLDPGRATLSIELGACAHRFAAGHRLRLQVSGGAHPRYARNPGTGESIATATSFAATHYTVHCDRSSLTLPIA